MATDNKYDRQLRLWGGSGQKALMEANILLVNASATGTETLKNLVLPGDSFSEGALSQPFPNFLGRFYTPRTNKPAAIVVAVCFVSFRFVLFCCDL